MEEPAVLSDIRDAQVEGQASCQRAIGLIFQPDTKERRAETGDFRKGVREMCTWTVPERITSVSTESSSHLAPNMYNLGAFDLCGRQQYPALQCDLPERDLPALCCEFRRILQHKRNTATSWKQEQ